MGRNRKIIAFLAATVAMLLLSALCEIRNVFSLVPGKDGPKEIGAAEYTEGASYDGFVLKDGKLYDAFSLTPEILRQKDCPT